MEWYVNGYIGEFLHGQSWRNTGIIDWNFDLHIHGFFGRVYGKLYVLTYEN
jgi:hypothetical protein